MSSGCGSKMIFPLADFFLSPTKVYSDFWDRRDGEWKPWRDPGLDAGGYGEGRVEWEVLVGAMSTPRGSLRPVSLDNSRTDPARRTHVSNALSNSNPKPDLPGTSSVSLSFRIPMIHFLGLILCSPAPSVDTGECIDSCVALDFLKNLRHPRTATCSPSFSAMSE